MTNQTVILSVLDYNPGTGIANVSGRVNEFIEESIKKGWMNFCIHKVVIVAETRDGHPTDKFLFTIQVDFYVPEMM